MVRNLIFIFLISSSFLFAQTLDEKIENIIGKRNYQIHKGLVRYLFKNRAFYVNGEQIKYFNLFKTLQENGLLDLRVPKRGNVTLKFKIFNNRQKGYKILNDTLETLGYKYFFTKVLENNTEYIIWDISFNAEYNVDPVVFIRELKQNGARVLEVTKLDEKSWSYEIDFGGAYLEKSTVIDSNEKVFFRKLLKPLLLKVDMVKSLEVRSHNLNRWYPKIVFFDQNLNVLKTIKYEKYQKRIKLDAPEGVRYIKVTDLYNLINIKRGLTIIVR
jgi:hypothetical protein